MEMEDKRIVVPERHGILISPETVHGPRPNDEPFERSTYKVFMEKGPLKETLQQQPCWIFPLNEVIDEASQVFLQETDEKQHFHTERMEAELSRLLIEVLRSLPVFQEEEVKVAGEKMDFQLDQIEEIDSWLEEHYMEKAGMPKLAARTSMSVRQMNRFFQEVYGMSFQQKLIVFRMDRAGVLLRTTDMTATEIAFAVGYSSESAFYQNFRQIYNVTPRQYRKQYRKKKNTPNALP